MGSRQDLTGPFLRQCIDAVPVPFPQCVLHPFGWCAILIAGAFCTSAEYGPVLEFPNRTPPQMLRFAAP